MYINYAIVFYQINNTIFVVLEKQTINIKQKVMKKETMVRIIAEKLEEIRNHTGLSLDLDEPIIRRRGGYKVFDICLKNRDTFNSIELKALERLAAKGAVIAKVNYSGVARVAISF